MGLQRCCEWLDSSKEPKSDSACPADHEQQKQTVQQATECDVSAGFIGLGHCGAERNLPAHKQVSVDEGHGNAKHGDEKSPKI